MLRRLRYFTAGAACLGALWAGLAPGVAAAAPEVATAQTRVVEGRVVAIEQKDVVIDLAAAQGVADGTVLEIWRPIEVRHPVTRRIVKDRFRIGSLKVTQTLQVMSLSRAAKRMLRDPAVGDVVLLRVAVDSPPPSAGVAPSTGSTPAPAPPKAQPGAPRDVDAERVAALFDAVRGAPPDLRVRHYRKHVSAYPGSRFVSVLTEEADLLEGHTVVAAAPVGAALLDVSFALPRAVRAGQHLDVAIHVQGSVAGAVLHHRATGEVSYRSVPMVAIGEGYFLVPLQGDLVRGPRLELFIETINAEGAAVPAIAFAAEPLVVPVESPPSARPPERYETTAAVMTDFADYNRLRGNDFAWQTEGYFGMRFGDTGMRALRSGFGVYRGKGGSIEELDEQKLDGREVGLTYGYLEGEAAPNERLGLIGRMVLGLGEDGVTGGAQAHLRIGSDRETNLMIGGEVLGGVGLRGTVQLELEPTARFPVLLRSEVTNQPAGTEEQRGTQAPAPGQPVVAPTVSQGSGDIGVRLIGQFGYRIVPSLVVALRGSYQGRNINHSGPGVGGAMVYTW